MKKLFSILLALMLIFSLGVTAFAAEGDAPTYTITMKTTADHSYTAYQVFAGELAVADGTKTLSNIQWGTGVNGDALLAALKADETYGDAFKNCTTAADVAKVLGNYTDGDEIKAIAKIIEANKAAVAGTSETSITGLAAGYYLITDTTTSMPQGQTYSDFMLEVVSDVEVTAKDGTTTSEKKVDDKNDSNTTEDATTWQDSADYDIGDNVPFQLKATVASDYDNYETYVLTFHDKESAGLSFNNDAKVYVDGVEITTGFTVVTTGLEDNCTFEVRFANLKQVASVKAESVITVEYTSKLNDNAVIGSAGNPNTMHIEYSNNPNSNQTGQTPDDTVIVFTYKVVVNKVDEKKEPLTGAGFTLYKKNASDEYVAVGEELKGGALTTFTWSGLDDGDYKLVETTTPSGYNTMEDILFTITAEHEVLSDNPALTSLSGNATTGEATFTPALDEGSLTTSVVNEQGSTLPSTGGIGTTIFYVLGGILVVGAAVMLIAKKRVQE